MDLGDVLDGSFRLVRTHWRAFTVGMGAVTVVPVLVILLVMGIWAFRFAITTQNLLETTPITDTDLSGLTQVGPAFGEMAVVMILLGLGWLFVVPLIYGVPVQIAAIGYRTGRVTAMDGLRGAGRRYPALLGTLLLLGLTMFGVILAIMIPLGVLAGITANVDAGGAFVGLLILGYIVAWVLAMIVAIRLSLAIPAVLVEPIGPVEALRRSNTLVKGKTLWVFATFLVVWIIATIAIFVVMFGSTALINGIALAVDSTAIAAAGGIIALIIMMFGYLMLYALFASTIVLVYFDRRVRTDGLDLSELANELGARDAPQW